MTEDDYMDKMRSDIRMARGWNFTAGIFFCLIWVFAVMFALNEDGFMGLGILVAICGMMIAFGRSFNAGLSIITNTQHLHDLVTLYESNSRGLQVPSSGGLAGAGGVKSDGGICLRPTGSETVLYFSEEIARHK
jgi:hypothetical protein